MRDLNKREHVSIDHVVFCIAATYKSKNENGFIDKECAHHLVIKNRETKKKV